MQCKTSPYLVICMHAQVLTWNSHSVDERISEAISSVRELDELLKQVKGVERRAHELAAEWSAHSLFERREGQVGHWNSRNMCLIRALCMGRCARSLPP